MKVRQESRPDPSGPAGREALESLRERRSWEVSAWGQLRESVGSSFQGFSKSVSSYFRKSISDFVSKSPLLLPVIYVTASALPAGGVDSGEAKDGEVSAAEQSLGANAVAGSAAPPPDGDDGDKGNGVPGDNKQFGKKFGEHRNVNQPGYRTPKEYRQLADRIYNDRSASRVTFADDATLYRGETHITDNSGNLLRLDPQGNFRSLYSIK
jgi:hypothetical protein